MSGPKETLCMDKVQACMGITSAPGWMQKIVNGQVYILDDNLNQQ